MSQFGKPPALALPVLFRDARFVVIDKPAGLPVHPGPRAGASVEDCFAALSRRSSGPWLAHRLDTDTSGCLAIALRRAALHQAQQAFAQHRVEKVYWAIVQGAPPSDDGVIEAPLLRRTTPAGWRMVVAPDGQDAATEWRVLGQAPGLSWIELRPRTGRTHQLRVHLAHIGCPIVGDPVYGIAGPTLHLLARSLRLPLDPVVSAEAPPPPHMRGALDACGFRTPATSP